MFHEVTSTPELLTGVDEGTPLAVQWLGTGRVNIQLASDTTFFVWPNAVQTFLPQSEGVTVFSENRGVLFYAPA